MRKIIINKKVLQKRSQRKYNIPIIGHFANRSIRFNSILEAEKLLGIPYHLIFEAAIGKIKGASKPGEIGLSFWEYENGMDWLKYKAYYIREKRKNYNRIVGFNG